MITGDEVLESYHSYVKHIMFMYINYCWLNCTISGGKLGNFNLLNRYHVNDIQFILMIEYFIQY